LQPFKILVILILAGIVLSLGSALFHLVTDRKGETRSMVRALTVRISLSVALFVLLFIAYAAGWIQPHGLRP
jgi:cytochrome bd-type quinol oxidase subunit 2